MQQPELTASSEHALPSTRVISASYLQVRSINAGHLRLALGIAKARLHMPDLPRMCALSNGATPLSCRPRAETDPSDKRWTHPPLCLPMISSVRDDLVKAVRSRYGVKEVQKVWGIGYRALLAELAGTKAVKP